MTSVKKYEDLLVWQQSMALVRDIYRLTDGFPKKEQYRLVDQMCRSAVSVPSNIAEGASRRSTKDYIRFINIAYGSLMECETQIRIAADLDYGDEITIKRTLDMTTEIAKMLNALHASLARKLDEAAITKYQIPTTKY